MRAVPRLCEFYPGICLTTEEKARKNLSQGSRRIPSHYKTHTHTLQNTHTHYKTHITKQYKTTTVQIKTNTEQDTRKWNSPNIIKYPQYRVTLIYRKVAQLDRSGVNTLHSTIKLTLQSTAERERERVITEIENEEAVTSIFDIHYFKLSF